MVVRRPIAGKRPWVVAIDAKILDFGTAADETEPGDSIPSLDSARQSRSRTRVHWVLGRLASTVRLQRRGTVRQRNLDGP